MDVVGSLRGQPSVTVFRHTVGNALVLHARERISSSARAVAMAIADDPDNEIVVLDLHDDLPVGIWKSVAATLRWRRRGIRLVVCGTNQDTAALAAQWLCDRLRRTVVTPHGRVFRGSDGTLFAHSGQASGWVRYRPGRPPMRQSKRYPAPPWDDGAAEFSTTSAVGAAEPIPAGVWLRDTRDALVVSERWRWLVASVPCQRQAMTVVLGCPGTPPLALDDIARFWRGLAPTHRPYARFVQYGPVQVPVGESIGQRLADLLETPVACFTGIPVGRPERRQMHTVTRDGRLGWRLLVHELGYRPRSRPAGPAAPARIMYHEAPALLGTPVGPRTFRYADDAVVEVVQSGLWVRATDEPRHAGRIRARPADPASHALIVDDADPSRVARLRELAEDLAARLDPATRARSALQLASAVAVSGRGPSAAVVDEDGLTYRFTTADLALNETETAALPVETTAPTTLGATLLGSGSARPAGGRLSPTAPASGRTAPEPAGAAGAAGAAGPMVARNSPRPAASGAAGGEPGVTVDTPLWTQTSSGDAPTRTIVAAPVLRLPPPVPVESAADGSSLAATEAAPTEARPGGGTAGAPPGPGDSGAAPSGIAGTDAVAPIGTATLARPAVLFQTPPAPQASGLPTSRGLDVERTWLRERFGPQFDAAASTVARILSEHPRLHPYDDALTDAVAVRLYLSGYGIDVDDALRKGDSGGAVSFARCVAAGVSRLPSHRGATCATATLTGDAFAEIRARSVLTNWAFTHALVEPPVSLPGAVDVLVWSMTARRTQLLEPADDQRVEARVLFLPGTRFKVLEATEPIDAEPGRVLLRELSADEPTRGRGPFDDLALNSLYRSVEQWATAGRRTPLGAAGTRFAILPGTI
ncbi:hypothetical protein [Micromonospora sp. LOL_015]|uniref:hypothetical protein n=1 Tax=Micromonospora sp. LOL_015 TaxID=3345416 RepID=UPI003A8552D6